jgi:predicted transposase YbfD/YdcC
VARQQDLRTATSHDKGHGRIEVRTIETLTKTPPWLDWPGVKQVCRMTHTRTVNGKTSVEIFLAITSLTRLQASAERLLVIARKHWSIENRLHYVRDVSFGEDACRVRSGDAPQNLAALRNVCLGIIRQTKFRYVPSAIRHFMAKPWAALALIAPGVAVPEEDF